ncbi:7-carboxy-7-deazaguanine synthase QueE [Francisellaceae bacterium]|nr:7-carboxy-7-deazaguanine synthase QueE [Francisellaceae bacterium]
MTSRITDYDKTLPIIEMYPCLQGEGQFEGRPIFALRTTGCTHRCHFGAGGWCDTWYSSIHADKGKYTFNDFVALTEQYHHIKEIMVTGGAPTMHPALLNEISHFAHKHKMFVTLETEGSHFIKTDYPLDFISLSPKFSNSIPELGIKTPLEKTIDEKFIQQHEKFRLNHDAIKQMLAYHNDYQIKPVWDGAQETLNEIKEFLSYHDIPKNKVYAMPAGQTREQLIEAYPIVMEMCLKEGFNFTGRTHIIAFDDKRAV